MITRGFAMFDTAIGQCGIAWSDAGVTRFQLPERDAAASRRRMAARFPDAADAAPPPSVQRGIDAIVALMRGERADLAFIPLDMDGVPEFHQRVYDVARTIRAGATMTYGEIAERLGDAGAARAVGQALGRNPFAVIVPCHRVTAAGGKTGGFSASGGRVTKLTLLAIEGAHLF
jgi:methylated-DNA-[protein]-cysteine S-methyltransferase